MTDRVRTVHLAESNIMGRSAVAVLVLMMQPTAILQLADQAAGSENLDKLGIPHLADLWSATMLLSGALMLVSYLVRRPDDTRVLEMAACGLLTIVSVVHLAAVLYGVGYSGASYTVALDVAVVINASGRAFFLGRQMWWVHRRTSL